VPTKLIRPNRVHLSSGGYQSKSLELSNQYKGRRRCGTNTRTPPARNLLGKGNRNWIALLRRQQNSTQWNGVISLQFNWVLETNFLKGRAISPWCFGTMACPCWQFMCYPLHHLCIRVTSYIPDLSRVWLRQLILWKLVRIVIRFASYEIILDVLVKYTMIISLEKTLIWEKELLVLVWFSVAFRFFNVWKQMSLTIEPLRVFWLATWMQLVCHCWMAWYANGTCHVPDGTRPELTVSAFWFTAIRYQWAVVATGYPPHTEIHLNLFERKIKKKPWRRGDLAEEGSWRNALLFL
jgi:hypothetical protein